MTTVELKSYSDLKEQLGAYGISIDDDLSKFAKVVHGISKEGYDGKENHLTVDKMNSIEIGSCQSDSLFVKGALTLGEYFSLVKFHHSPFYSPAKQ
jgi:hypothetical protein